jgi:hypothetical protein
VGWTSGPPVLDVQERMRANLEAGASHRFRRRTKVAAVLLFIFLVVGSCTAFAWLFAGQYLSLGQQVARAANGKVGMVLILGTRDSALVQVYMARGVADSEVRYVVCLIVLPELTAAGIQPSVLQVYSSNARLIASGVAMCSAPLPTTPPSPAPNSGNQPAP